MLSLASSTCAGRSLNIRAALHVTKQPRKRGKLVARKKVLCIECGVHLTDKVSVSVSDETSWLLLPCVKKFSVGRGIWLTVNLMNINEKLQRHTYSAI